jgi:Outer membrane protein beta-barrel domain
MRATAGRRTVTMVLALGTILGLASWVPRAAAAESERATKWQGSIPITFTSGASYDSEFTSVDVNDDLGWGFGFGYNLNERFMVGADFTWLSANFNASTATDIDGDGDPDDSIDLGGTLDAANLQFVGQYNILKGRITPFIRASLGWTWIDSNIPSGPATGTCWWDPWWGYVCNTWQPTYEKTAFAYGAAAGLRAEIGQRFYLEGSYNVLWVDFDKAGTQDLDGGRITMGWLF